jgi:hypothetical protein
MSKISKWKTKKLFFATPEYMIQLRFEHTIIEGAVIYTNTIPISCNYTRR